MQSSSAQTVVDLEKFLHVEPYTEIIIKSFSRVDVTIEHVGVWINKMAK